MGAALSGESSAASATGRNAPLGPQHAALFRELNDLKRIRSAGREGSIATRLFATGWGALASAIAPERVMRVTVSTALAAVRLGDLDRQGLTRCGLSSSDAVTVLQRGFDEVSTALQPSFAAMLRATLAEPSFATVQAPGFVRLLADQPRAGVTCPGRPRLVLEPPENHAEHSLMVAVCGAIAAPAYGADPTAVFLAGMGHHLHGAIVPDSGFAGEMLLGDLLDAVVEHGRAEAFAVLAPPLAAALRQALEPISADRTAEARAFHAADVIDRVLQIEQHLKVSGTTMQQVIGDYGLVHDGPVKGFHDQVLAQVGLSQ